MTSRSIYALQAIFPLYGKILVYQDHVVESQARLAAKAPEDADMLGDYWRMALRLPAPGWLRNAVQAVP